jgi:ribosomal protein L11 methyltransferase
VTAERRWLAVRVRTGGRPDAVAAALFSVGVQALQEQGDEFLTQVPVGTDTEALIRVICEGAPQADVQITDAPDVDWMATFRQGIRAQDLGHIVVAPPWLASDFDPARTVVIDPAMAFGTGEHATTRGVVRLLPRVLRTGELVADLGAGSAVLSIAAAKLGAGRVVAIELDPDAMENAEENVRRNAVADRVTVLEGDARLLLPLVAPVGLVLANIISSVLLDLLPDIAKAVGSDGRAILSGILADERDEMLGAVLDTGWRVIAEDAEDAWWSVAITR